ncbi:MAG: pantetheine-phosphate adenylyltransferase [Chloroflexota bacterium]
MRIAVYPGSFDPVTNGHLDVLGRALGVYDRVVVAVLGNPRKRPLLTADERIAVLRTAIDEAGLPSDRVEVSAFDGLTVDAVRAHGGTSIVRGLRAVSDFEVEMQLAHNNRKLAPDLDTVFFMTALEHGYVSSSLVKEIASFGGDVTGMVPKVAAKAIAEALAHDESHRRVP